LSGIRAQLERKLSAAPGYVPASDRSMADLTMLSTDALTQLVDLLGASEIAPAVAALGPEAPSLFATRLASSAAGALQMACRAVPEEQRMSPEAGRQWLTKLGDVQDVKNLVRRAGVKRLARACLSEGNELLARIAGKHPGPIGRALQGWGEALE